MQNTQTSSMDGRRCVTGVCAFTTGLSQNDAHTLVIDSVRASVGSVTEIMQSGFAEGKHTFRVIVYDSYGDADSLSEKTFYMLDTLRGQR